MNEFESADRGRLWEIMRTDGVHLELVSLIRAYYNSTSARVRVYGEESREFNLHTGVRQGCPLSPVLYNYIVDWIMNQALTDDQQVQPSGAGDDALYPNSQESSLKPTHPPGGDSRTK